MAGRVQEGPTIPAVLELGLAEGLLEGLEFCNVMQLPATAGTTHTKRWGNVPKLISFRNWLGTLLRDPGYSGRLMGKDW
jgi:hypothetical protein